jgi:alkylhydroperoxidase family enzyme
MARIEPLTIREWPPDMRDALAAMTPPEPRHASLPTANRPKALNTLGTFAHHTALAKAFFTFNGHILRATTLTERQRELLVLRVAALRGCRYEWTQHMLIAGDTGLTTDEIARIEAEPASPRWSDLEAAMLRAVAELLADGVIAESTWPVLATELDAQQLLDLIFTVGAYETLAWMMRSFDLDLDEDLLEAVARSDDD